MATDELQEKKECFQKEALRLIGEAEKKANLARWFFFLPFGYSENLYKEAKFNLQKAREIIETIRLMTSVLNIDVSSSNKPQSDVTHQQLRQTSDRDTKVQTTSVPDTDTNIWKQLIVLYEKYPTIKEFEPLMRKKYANTISESEKKRALISLVPQLPPQEALELSRSIDDAFLRIVILIDISKKANSITQSIIYDEAIQLTRMIRNDDLRPSLYRQLVQLMLKQTSQNSTSPILNAPTKALGKRMLEVLYDENLQWINLKSATLVGADFSSKDLSYADLSEANISNADFSNAKLRSTKLERANLSYASFIYAMMYRTNLHQANLSNAILKRADLRDADLSMADLTNADFSEVNLTGANFEKAIISGTNFHGAKLSPEQIEIITKQTPLK